MKHLVGIFVFFMSVGLLAQMNSMVYLKNGSAIRGEVVKNDATGISLRTKDGSYWNFDTVQVERIERFVPTVKDRGFYNLTSLGLLGGELVSISARVVNGYTFNRHWEAGFGLGFEQLRWNPYVPVFLEGRYQFLNGSTRPFVALHGGYAMPVRNFEFDKGGLTGGAELGVTHYFSSHLGISTSVGYRYARLAENSMWWDDFKTITQMNRFEIRLGLVFR